MTRMSLVSLLAAVMMLGACGDDRINPLYVTSFGVDKNEVVVGQTFTKNVVLSEAPEARVYVEVKNSDYDKIMEVTFGTQKNAGIVIKYEAGVSSHTVNFKGLKAGSGYVRFQIRGTNKYQDLDFLVKDLVYPDSGPDTGVPDGGVMDTGAVEASVSDMAVNEASTADMAAKEASAADLAATE